MHNFFATSRSHKHALRRTYDRFRELTPVLAYKGQKQRDLNEVKLLEWRLLAQVSEYQGRIKDIDKTLADYERLPIWKRLGLQTVGKNVATLGEYRRIDEEKIVGLMKQVEIAQARIENCHPKRLYRKRCGRNTRNSKRKSRGWAEQKKFARCWPREKPRIGKPSCRTNDWSRATPGRVITDPLFTRVRFDVLIAEDAPNVPAPFLLGVAGLIRERIIIAGDTRDLRGTHGLWRQQCWEPRLSRVTSA